MIIRFQADADLNHNIVVGVLRREPKIDFQTALTAKLEGLPDNTVLEIAAREKRILVSHDLKTMPFHFAEFITCPCCLLPVAYCLFPVPCCL